jgi:hypothetical protein
VLEHALRQPGALHVLQQLPDAMLEVSGASFQPRLDPFADGGAEHADNQINKD